ncbi:hypothetical protein SLS54_005186 [Diplodia seriata]
MAQTQHENRPPIQEFLFWFKQKQELGTRGPSTAVDQPFISNANIGEVFGEIKIEKILSALSVDAAHVHASRSLILNKYRKVFCILLSIGKGQFIENFIPHESLNDSKLPFQAQPADFPQSTESLFEQFRDAQWMFNAAFFEPYRTHLCLSPQHILPILKIEDIKGGEGHSAVVRKVVLHEAHYQLPPRWSANRPGSTFALKTYRPENAKRNFHRECNAFSTLMRNGQCTPGLIGFFGSFIHGDTYNLLLEYADQGTLEDYFHNVSAPWQSDDISSFWSGLSGISKALVAIHGEIEREGDESPIQQGSLKRYKGDVAGLLGLLAFIVKGSDDDGIDVHFTSPSTKEINTKSYDTIIDNISAREYSDSHDMAAALKRVLDKFFQTPSKGSSRRRPKTRKPMTCYILTDGQWRDPENVVQELKLFVSRLKENNIMQKGTVGIQFITFGGDEKTNAFFHRLDSNLGLNPYV